MTSLVELVSSTLESQERLIPRLVHGGDPIDPFPRITMDRLDEFLAKGPLRPPQFTIVHGGKRASSGEYRSVLPYPGFSQYRVPDALDYGRLEQAIAAGDTLMLNGCDMWLPDLAAATNDMRRLLGHPVLATMFLTPADEAGLAVHSDPMDAFVVQLHGSKTWKVYDRPAASVPIGEVERGLLSEPRLTLTLNVGDVLFLPRGCPHETRADALSLHVTLGINRLTVRDLLTAALRRCRLPTELDQPLPFAQEPPERANALLRSAVSTLTAQLEAAGWPAVLAQVSGSTLPTWQPGALARMSEAALPGNCADIHQAHDSGAALTAAAGSLAREDQ